jgi:hypothetical protein
VTDGLPGRVDGDAEALLTAWEHGLAYAPHARGDAMLRQLESAAASPTLGIRNRKLIAVHERLFGDDLDLTSRCASCGATVQFSTRCRLLVGDDESSDPPLTAVLDAAPYLVAFRLPDQADVAIAAAGTEETFARELMHRCIIRSTCNGAAVAAADLPDLVLDAVSRRMQALDPLAVVSFSLECPDCAMQWDAPLDVDHLLWTKVQAAAERLLLDVDVLARAYGWTEEQVLALRPARRAAYLQLAGG